VTNHRPLFMQPAGGDPDNTYTGTEMRALFAAAYPYQGVIRMAPGAYLVAQRGAGANLSVDVAAGYAVVTGDDVAGQGNYLCWSDATYNLAMPAAPGSGTRFHRVGLRVKDKLANGTWTTYEFIPDVVQDTGAGFPAEPASFITLAQASITAGQVSYQTAQLTDLRQPAEVIQGATRAANSAQNKTTTLTGDTVLTVPVAASATYEFRFNLYAASASTTSGFKLGWGFPSGATGNYQGISTNAAGGSFFAPVSLATVTTGLVGGTANADYGSWFSGIIQTGATPGSLQVQYAESVADAANGAYILAPSSLTLTRIA